MTRLANANDASLTMIELVREHLNGFELTPDLFFWPEEANQLESDVFALLYSIRQPEIVIQENDSVAKLLAEIVDTSGFRRLRAKSILDPVFSALSVRAVLETLGLTELQRRRPEAMHDCVPETMQERAEKTLEINEALNDADGFARNVSKGSGGNAPGSTELESELEQEDAQSLIARRMQIASALQDNPSMINVMEALGQLEEVRNELLDDEIQAEDCSTTIELGDELTKTDLGYLASRPAEMIVSDMADQALEMIEGEDKGGLGNGPVIAVLDRSSSMNRPVGSKSHHNFNRFEVALATAFSLLQAAQAQNRNFVLIMFNQRVHSRFEFTGEKIEIKDFVRLLGLTARGTTCFSKPLNEILETLPDSNFEKADVIWLTDGEVEVNDKNDQAFEFFEKTKRRFDSQGTKNFVINFGAKRVGYCMRCLGNAGPSNFDHFTMRLEPKTDERERLFDSITDFKMVEDSMRSIFAEVKKRNFDLDLF